ncbi:MAG: TolB family protein [Myxococcota bacterium]
MTGFLGRATAVAGLAVVAACSSGRLPQSDLPADPIAFVRQEAKQGIASLDQFMAAVDFLSPEELEKRKAGGSSPPRAARTSLMLIDPRTGALRAVPDAGLGTLPLDWSSDGNFLLIGRVRRGGFRLRLFSWNRLTGAYTRLVPGITRGNAALGAGPIRLVTLGLAKRADGSVSRQILVTTDDGTWPLPGGVNGTEPDVAPDGRSLIFVRRTGRKGGDGVILRHVLGEDAPRPLGRGRAPRLSRDGRWIAYVSWRRGNGDIWLMRSDGSGRRPVAQSDFNEGFPAVSPHGRYVVYASARGSEKESQLFITRVSDGAERQLTQNAQNGRPVW